MSKSPVQLFVLLINGNFDMSRIYETHKNAMSGLRYWKKIRERYYSKTQSDTLEIVELSCEGKVIEKVNVSQEKSN